MTHWEKWQCRGCGVVISNSKERRMLDPAINQAGRRMSTDLQCGRRDVKQMLLPRDLSVKGVDRSYLCRKSCFASLDKIINHEKNIAELTAEVKQIRQDFLKNVERLSSIGQTTVHNIPSCHGWLCTSSNSICFIEKFTTHYSYNCSFTESHCKYLTLLRV